MFLVEKKNTIIGLKKLIVVQLQLKNGFIETVHVNDVFKLNFFVVNKKIILSFSRKKIIRKS